jgi:hypothetical protein
LLAGHQHLKLEQPHLTQVRFLLTQVLLILTQVLLLRAQLRCTLLVARSLGSLHLRLHNSYLGVHGVDL